MSFKVGDLVRFLHDVGEGRIIEISQKKALVIDEYGFEYEYALESLVIKMKMEEVNISKQGNAARKLFSDSSSKSIRSKKGTEEMKIDLHMENLSENHFNMTNHEIVTEQLKHLKQFILSAEKKKISRMIVVHGVGTGKLKQEIRQYVSSIKGAEIFDANYTEYGFGASVIERKYNWR